MYGYAGMPVNPDFFDRTVTALSTKKVASIIKSTGFDSPYYFPKPFLSMPGSLRSALDKYLCFAGLSNVAAQRVDQDRLVKLDRADGTVLDNDGLGFPLSAEHNVLEINLGEI